jgi:hypothetical protein
MAAKKPAGLSRRVKCSDRGVSFGTSAIDKGYSGVVNKSFIAAALRKRQSAADFAS